MSRDRRESNSEWWGGFFGFAPICFLAIAALITISCGSDSDPGGEAGSGGTSGSGGSGPRLPVIEAVEPSSGPVGLSPVFIRGTALVASSVEVYFGDVLSVTSDVSTDGTWIETAVPAGARTGAVNLVLDGVRVDGPNFTVTAGNPRPRLTSIDPSKVEKGSPRTRVVLTGSGFFEDSVVRFDGEAVLVDWWSRTSLAVTLEPGPLVRAGNHEFIVENGPPGGGVSEPARFSVWEPFRLRFVRPTSSTTIELEFSSPPDPVAALDKTLYAINGGAWVVGVELGDTDKKIDLTTTPLTTGAQYLLGVSRTLTSIYGAELAIGAQTFLGP